MSTRYRRHRIPPLVRLVVAVIRLQIDLLDVVFRAIAWLLEHVCTQLERVSAALRTDSGAPPIVPTERAIVPSKPAPLPRPTLPNPSEGIKTGKPAPQPQSELDKMAAALWAPSRGKPDYETYELARSMLAKRMLAATNGKAD